MKRLPWPRALSSFVLLVIITVATARAESPPGLVVLVRPGCPDTTVTRGELLATVGPFFNLVSVGSPQLGELIAVGPDFLYRPGPQFWTAGTDSFTYTLEPGNRLGERVTGTVLLNAGLNATPALSDGFEQGWSHGWEEVDPAGVLVAAEDAALSGFWGLRVDPVPGGGEAYLYQALEAPRGGGDTGTGSQSTIRVPGTGHSIPIGASSKILSMGDPGGAWVNLWLRQAAAGYELGLEAEATTSWRPVAAGVHRVRVVWWEEGVGIGCDAGAALWLDGALHTLTPMTTGPIGVANEVRIGRMAEIAPMTAPIDFDDVVIEEFDGTWQQRELVQMDGFEAGVADPGWSVIPPTALVKDTAALAGQRGLEIVLGSGATPLGVQLVRNLAPRARRLGGRFSVNPVVLSLPNTGWVRLLTINNVAAVRLASLSLRNEAGVLQLEVKVLEHGGALRMVLVPLGSDPKSRLGFDWQSAGGADAASTGVLRVWRDGQLVVELTGLANGGQEAYQLRFGAIAGTSLASGVVHLDQFESWTW